MKNQNIKQCFRVLAIASGVFIFAACSQNSTNHDAGAYSNGNRDTDSSASYNNSAANRDSTGMSTRPTTASDTMHRNTPQR